MIYLYIIIMLFSWDRGTERVARAIWSGFLRRRHSRSRGGQKEGGTRESTWISGIYYVIGEKGAEP